MSQISFSTRDAMVDIEIYYKNDVTLFTIYVNQHGYSYKTNYKYPKSGLIDLLIILDDGTSLPNSFYLNGIVYKNNVESFNRRIIPIGDEFIDGMDTVVANLPNIHGSITIDTKFYLSGIEAAKLKYKMRGK